MEMITVVKTIKSTRKADMVLAHFDDPSQFTLCWLPRSQCQRTMDQYWSIPNWLKKKIQRESSWMPAQQYNDDRFGSEGIECYAYGTESTGYFTREGKEIGRQSLL